MSLDERMMICEKHGEYKGKIVKCLGIEIAMKCPKCKEEEDIAKQKEQERLAAIAEAERIAIWLNKSGIPNIYKGLDNFVLKDTQKPLEKYDFKKNLVLYGGVGTGKTMVASWLAYKAIKNNMRVRYLYANEIDKKAKSSWGTNLTEDDILEQFIDCDLLILDEIGRVQYNDYLFKVFDGRYMNNKPTILIGNIDIKEIPKILGEAISSRLRVNVSAVCLGTQDMRGPF